MSQFTLFAMTKKGFAVLRAVHERFPGTIRTVISSRDEHLAEDHYDDMRDFCLCNSIDFCDRHDAGSIATPYALAVSWRWLIDTKDAQVVVLHDSLLPRLRGFNPLVTALINGDRETGVTALFAADEFDTGDLIAQSKIDLRYPMTIRTAIDLILDCYTSLALDVTESVLVGRPLRGTPQQEDQVTYSLWRDEEDYFIDWESPADAIRRKIDAVGFPYRGAASYLEGRVVRILEAEEQDDVAIENPTPGKVLFIRDGAPVVVCGKGLLRIARMTDASGLPVNQLPGFRMRFS